MSKAVVLEELEKIVAAEKLKGVLISMNEAVVYLPRVVLSETEIEKTRNGIKFKFENEKFTDNQAVRMIDAGENLVAVGFYNRREKYIQPRVVLR